ncbi:MAG: hypothetical protein RLZZ385_2582 [Pseudomonadota bacterium]|jgi:uncharacterized protein (TIGR00661 family)
MKILYGVQGTGNGHISRARMMAQHFHRLGVDVVYLFSGRERQDYFDMEIFGDFICRRGFTFSFRDGRLQYVRTLMENDAGKFLSDIRQLDLTDYDLVVTDYEPITAWAARLRKKPVVGLGHQYAFKYRVPMEGDDAVSRWLLRNFAPAEVSFGLHWSHFGHNLLPPIVDPQLTRNHGQDARPNKILVYLPFENQQFVTSLLKQIAGYDFYQYSSELNDGEDGNVQLRKTCHEGFKYDLSTAGAVICNAGFELVSECIHLGLRVMVKPLHQQAEQLSNAKALVELGLGERIDSLSVAAVEQWLTSLQSHPVDRGGAYPDVAEAIAEWIVAGDYSDTGKLTRRLWSRCQPRNPLKENGLEELPRQATA